jgi:hypothetical protein
MLRTMQFQSRNHSDPAESFGIKPVGWIEPVPNLRFHGSAIVERSCSVRTPLGVQSFTRARVIAAIRGRRWPGDGWDDEDPHSPASPTSPLSPLAFPDSPIDADDSPAGLTSITPAGTATTATPRALSPHASITAVDADAATPLGIAADVVPARPDPTPSSTTDVTSSTRASATVVSKRIYKVDVITPLDLDASASSPRIKVVLGKEPESGHQTTLFPDTAKPIRRAQNAGSTDSRSSPKEQPVDSGRMMAANGEVNQEEAQLAAAILRTGATQTAGISPSPRAGDYKAKPNDRAQVGGSKTGDLAEPGPADPSDPSLKTTVEFYTNEKGQHVKVTRVTRVRASVPHFGCFVRVMIHVSAPACLDACCSWCVRRCG